MAKKFWIIMGLLMGIGGSSLPQAYALGWLSPVQDPYLLNLCQYYALPNTRVANINPELLLKEARVEARVLSENCSDIQASENIETAIRTNYIVELIGFRETLDRVQDQFKAKVKAANLKCTPEKHLLVTLTFLQLKTGTLHEVSPMDLKSARGGFVWDAQGRPLELIERGPAVKTLQESTSPEIRCESVTKVSPRISKPK